MNTPLRIFRFGDFELEEAVELRKNGEPVELQPKPLRLLLHLVQNRGRVVAKEELYQTVWPDVNVSESALTSALRDLRRVLGDDGSAQRVIRTLRGHGYRFVAEVDVRPAPESPESRGGVESEERNLPAIVQGIVRRTEDDALIIDLGQAEAIVPLTEQVPSETFGINELIRAYVLEDHRPSRGLQNVVEPKIILSRACTEFLTKLFEEKVPEIYGGSVCIEAAVREPGALSKIAVRSLDSDVDPVGACVGLGASRIQAVQQELRGEKIDIVPWDPDPVRYVSLALSPAKVVRVVVDSENRSMDIIVPDTQFWRAYGKKGQNVRLAAQLTRWNIEVSAESHTR